MLMNYNGEGYLYYHIYKEGEYDYFYNNSCSNHSYIYFVNDTYLRYSFSSFSNSTEINYSLIIVEDNKYINSNCEIFNNFYLNPIINDDVAIINFSLKNIIVVQSLNNCSNNSYIDIEIPNIIKNKKEKKTFLISGIGITGPIIKDGIIYDKIELLYQPKISPSENSPNQFNYLYIIIIFIIVIIILVVIFIFKRAKRGKNGTIDSNDLTQITELNN